MCVCVCVKVDNFISKKKVDNFECNISINCDLLYY